MKRLIPSTFAILFSLGITYFPTITTAATCEAYGFDNLQALLKDVSKCPDTKAPGRYYIELRLNSYINAPLIIPAKTTIRGNLLSDPGKPTALESNFNPDDTYQSGFNMFKQGKVPPPNCLVTLNDESALANVQLTKVYAKNGICAGSNSIIVNVEVQGPDLDMKEPFVGVAVTGDYNKFFGLIISANKGTPISYSADKNQYSSAFVSNIDTYLYGNSSAQAAPENKLPEEKAPPPATDINKQLICPSGSAWNEQQKACVKSATDNAKQNLNPQPATVGPLQPIVASPNSGAGCSLTETATAASPILAFLATITLTGLVAYRSQPKKIHSSKEDRRHV